MSTAPSHDPKRAVPPSTFARPLNPPIGLRRFLIVRTGRIRPMLSVNRLRNPIDSGKSKNSTSTIQK